MRTKILHNTRSHSPFARYVGYSPIFLPENHVPLGGDILCHPLTRKAMLQRMARFIQQCVTCGSVLCDVIDFWGHLHPI